MLKINVRDLEQYHKSELSRYNYNIYKLPIPINDREYLIAKSDDDGCTIWGLSDTPTDEFYSLGMWLGVTFSNMKPEYINLLDYRTDCIWT